MKSRLDKLKASLAFLSDSQIDSAIILILSVTAFALRLPRTLAPPSISTDEFRYAVFSQEISDVVKGTSHFQMSDIIIQHPLVPYIVGLVAVVLPINTLIIGRLVQLTFNSLTIPLIYVLARQLGFKRWICLGAAISMSVMYPFWLRAVHFWPDSQFTFLFTINCILFLSVLRDNRAGIYKIVAASAVALAATTLTREYTPLLFFIPGCYLLAHMTVEQKIATPRLLSIAMTYIAGVLIAFVIMSVRMMMPRSEVILANLNKFITAEIHDPSYLRDLTQGSFDNVRRLEIDLYPVVRDIGDNVDSIFILFAVVGVLASLTVVLGSVHRLKGAPGAERLIVMALALIGSAALVLDFGFLCAALLSHVPGVVLMGFILGGSYFAWHVFVIVYGKQRNAVISSLSEEYYSRHSHIGTCLSFCALTMLSVFVFRAFIGDLVFVGPRYFFPIYPLVSIFVVLGIMTVSRLDLLIIFLSLYSTLNLFTDAFANMNIAVVLLGLLVLAHYIWNISRIKRVSDQWMSYVIPTAVLIVLLLTPFTHLVHYSRQAVYVYWGVLKSQYEYPVSIDHSYYYNTGGGVRIRRLNELRPWLEENIAEEDLILTNRPSDIIWAAGTGLRGFYNTTFSDWQDFVSTLSARSNRDADFVVGMHPGLHRNSTYDEWIEVYERLLSDERLQLVHEKENADGRLEFYVFQSRKDQL